MLTELIIVFGAILLGYTFALIFIELAFKINNKIPESHLREVEKIKRELEDFN